MQTVRLVGCRTSLSWQIVVASGCDLLKNQIVINQGVYSHYFTEKQHNIALWEAVVTNIYVAPSVTTVISLTLLHDHWTISTDYRLCALFIRTEMSSFGVGVYFLTVLWFITLMLCWVSVRTGHNIGKISVIVTSLVTLVLVCLPKGETYDLNSANFYDRLYIPRYAILTFLLLSGAVGLSFAFVHVCLAPNETRKIRSFGTVN